MRLSTDISDPGYQPFAGYCKVFFNGEPLHCATMADEERGVVRCIAHSGDGHYLHNGYGGRVDGYMFGKVIITGYWEAISLYNESQMKLAGVGRVH